MKNPSEEVTVVTKTEPAPTNQFADVADAAYDPASDDAEQVRSPKPSKAPATPPEEPTETNGQAKPHHPRGLVRRAMIHGATQEQIDSVSVDELDEWLERQDALLEREVQQAAVDTSRMRGDEDETALRALEEEVGVDKRLTGLVRRLAKENKELKGTAKTIVDRDAVRTRQSLYDAWDEAFEALPDHKLYFGDGSGQDLDGSSPEIERRNAVISRAGIVDGDSPKTIARKIKSMAQRLYPIQPKAAPKEEEEETPSGYTGQLGAKKVARQPNGKERITEEQWKEAGLAKPTSRNSKEPRSTKKAYKAVQQAMAENEITDDDFTAFAEEETLPE